jgi:dTDP-4-amino-4,6-dideoxygalactose transaminase
MVASSPFQSTSSDMSAAFFLPEADVPELEFAGLKAQYAALKDAIAPQVAEVFRHGRFIMGPEVETLETALAQYTGAKYAISVSSGTDALIAPLMAADIGHGDAVFLPAFTFTATAEVALLLGASPVFVDVDARSFNIDVGHLEAQIDAVRREGTLRPAAIVPVDLFGLPADYAELQAIAERNGLFLLADAAQSFGASRGSRKVGSLAPVTATSFFPAKPLGCYGDGGAIFTDDPDLCAKLRSIRAHGQGAEKYSIDRVGLNARLDTLQAAVLLAKLPALPGEITARNALADRYDAVLSNAAVTPLRPPNTQSAFAQYTILVEERAAVQKRLGAAGIPTAIYYPTPMHFQPPYAAFSDGPGSLPVSEALSEKVLSLPMHAYMLDEVADRIADTVNRTIRA